MMNKVSAPGKIILSGEHAVVYGYPAVAAAIDLRLMMNSNLQVKSDIPLGCGLGSSAAYSVALAAIEIILQDSGLDKPKIAQRALRIEKQFHSNPSGIDTTTSTYGGFVWFQRKGSKRNAYKLLATRIEIPSFIFINTGRPIESTREMILMVEESYTNNSRSVISIMNKIEKVTNAILGNLTGSRNLDFGELIQENERYLEELNIVTESTKTLIRKIEVFGGSGKVCGAGGRKQDSGIVLTYHPDIDKLKNFLSKNKVPFFYSNLGVEGVKKEN